LRQLREELRLERPRTTRRDADARLDEGWSSEVRRRRLVEAVERELESGDGDEDARPAG
jgi:hypothetical protein